MSPSLHPAAARRIAALHAQGYSDRWIARRFQLSNPTIAQKLREIRSQSDFPPGDPPPQSNGDPPGYDAANVRRCRGCGALVYLWPCLACCLSEQTATAIPATPSHR